MICTLLENAFSFPIFIFHYRHLRREAAGEHMQQTGLGRPRLGQPRRALQRTSCDLKRGRHVLMNKWPTTCTPTQPRHDHTHRHSSSPIAKRLPYSPFHTPPLLTLILPPPPRDNPALTPTPTHRGYTFTSTHTHDTSLSWWISGWWRSGQGLTSFPYAMGSILPFRVFMGAVSFWGGDNNR